MAQDTTALTLKVEKGSPYQLDQGQTAKAAGALLKHIRATSQRKEADFTTKNLLATDPTSSDTSLSDAEPIWLSVTTKKFITDQRRLKPRKIALPHSLITSPKTSICLITPEPQRHFKDAIAHPSFPTTLSQRITKVISVQKLEKKYHSFESKRQLRDDHDIFLADDRIITYLAKSLGKTFYKSTPKRPIPVHLELSKPRPKKNAALPSIKPRKEPTDTKSIASPPSLAKEIEDTLSTASIHLSPSTQTSIKVGLASFTSQQLAANIKAVITGLTDKLIAWKNVRAIHIKGLNTMALPIWLADELWTDEAMILEEDEAKEAKSREAQKGRKKRIAIAAPEEESLKGSEQGKKRKVVDDKGADVESRRQKAKRLEEEDFSSEMKERRERLRQQKKEARAKVEAEIARDTQTKSVAEPKDKSLKKTIAAVQSNN